MDTKNTNKDSAFSGERLYSEIALDSDLSPSDVDTLINTEEALFLSLKTFQDADTFSSKSIETKAFQEELDFQKMESAKERFLSPLPKYLKNYVDMSFQDATQKERSASLVIKIAREGLRLLGGIFDSNVIQVTPALGTSVRSKEKEISDFINLEEVNRFEEIHYQVIRENEEEAYLCINFPDKHHVPYQQVNLKKNNRFIYSSQIGESGAVSFSGLKEGKYNVEFIGKKTAKSIDLTILVDHP